MVGRQHGIAGRLVALVTATLALALVLAGVIAYVVQRAEVLEQADGELLQEVEELRQLSDQSAADRPYRDVGVLLEDFLGFSVPGSDESMIAFVGDSRVPALVSGGERRIDLTEPAVIDAVLTQRRPDETVLSTVETPTQDLRIAITPVQGDDGQGTLVVGIDRGARLDRVDSLLSAYGVGALLTLLLAGAVLLVAVRRLLSPLGDLVEAAEQIDDRELSRRVVVPEQRTEVASLATSLNTMLERLESSFVAQRRFLDDTAHELRTPLTIMRGNLEVLDAEDVEDVEATRHIELVEIDRMRRIVDDLLLLARLDRPDFVRPAPIDARDLHVDLLALVPALGDHEWVDDGCVEGVVHVDRDRVVQAVQQLCANAVKFSEPGSQIRLRTAWRGAGEDRALVLSVADDGVGIAPEEQEAVFERFGRAEGQRAVEGSGLGLPIVRAIAHAHGGEIEIDSRPGEGSTFSLVVPAPEPEPSPRAR